MTTSQTRDRIVAHVAARGGWVPIGVLLPWMVEELHLTRGQGPRASLARPTPGKPEGTADWGGE